ncbi:MAG: hypothetical protein FJ403_20540 [Verrucomicrobia bacterium]|nr:hypothetical protein [Verrucomicrobiota bacterium]
MANSAMRKMWDKLPKSRGKRFLAIAGIVMGSGILFLLIAGVTLFFLFRSPRFQAWLWPAMMRCRLLLPWLTRQRFHRGPLTMDRVQKLLACTPRAISS